MHRTLRPVAAAALAAAAVLPAQNTWLQTAAAGSGPGYGLWPGMAYVLSTGTCILYGGANGAATSSETWEYDGATASWTQRNPATNPGERHTFAICYDSARDVVVMFGGSDNSYTPSGETWEYSPSTGDWTNVTPISGIGPQARWGCHMAYDLIRGVAVLYGGWSGAGFTNDTWEWNGTTWTQVTTANLPAGRDRFGFCYDLLRGRCVLFGGITSAGASDETWEYDGVDWTLLSPPTRPSPRQKVRLAYDPTRGVCILQGGQAAGQQVLDSWEFHGALGAWRRIPSNPQPARGENAFTFDILRGAAVSFGGYSYNGTNTDTWEYAAATAPTFTVFGTGCPGSNGNSTIAAAAGSAPALGTTLSIEFGNLNAAGGAGFVLLGASNQSFAGLFLPLDLSILGWSGCTGYVRPDVANGFVHTSSTHTQAVPIPAVPQLQGFTLYAQALLLDAGAPNGAVAASPAAEAIVY